jgi:dephospho-CoA kinase
MPKVLVTGMSGTGKSAALQALGERGHRVVDTDTDQWSHWVTHPSQPPASAVPFVFDLET